MAMVAEDFADKSIEWTKYDVKRLICKCHANRKVDSVLGNMGESFSLDPVHNMIDDGNDDDEDDADNSSEKSDEDGTTAVGEDDDTSQQSRLMIRASRLSL